MLPCIHGRSIISSPSPAVLHIRMLLAMSFETTCRRVDREHHLDQSGPSIGMYAHTQGKSCNEVGQVYHSLRCVPMLCFESHLTRSGVKTMSFVLPSYTAISECQPPSVCPDDLNFLVARTTSRYSQDEKIVRGLRRRLPISFLETPERT